MDSSNSLYVDISHPNSFACFRCHTKFYPLLSITQLKKITTKEVAVHPMAVGAAILTIQQQPFTLKSKRFVPSIPFKKPLQPSRCPVVLASLVKANQTVSFTEPESALIEALIGIQGRGRAASKQQLKEVEDAVCLLEDIKGVPNPTSSGLIEGRWKLIFTTRPGTASPIQRTFVGVDYFKVFQEVYLTTDDQRVSNIVRFSDAIGELKVEAAATVEDGKRILFKFDRAAFSFNFLPFKVPYPVPFRLLGDEAKGWLDTTYLSPTGNIRISRGNKGTTFVLQKKTELRQKLLDAISIGYGVKEVIDELILKKEIGQIPAQGFIQNFLNLILRKKEDRGYDKSLEGEWQLIWSSQQKGKNWEAIAANGLKGLQTVKENGEIQNQVEIFPGLMYCASGTLSTSSDMDTYNVDMNDGYAIISGYKFPIEINSKYIFKILYIDNKIRITQIDDDLTAVHLRIRSPVI